MNWIIKLRFILMAISFAIIFLPFNSAGTDEDGLQISVVIIPMDVQYEELVVGDGFTYEIFLFNKGDTSIISDFSVEIYQPDRKLIEWSAETFNGIKILPQKEIRLSPKYPGRSDKVKVFKFNMQGTYEFKINSTEKIDFIEEDTTQFHPSTFQYFFDAMPLWEKRISDRTTDVVSSTEKYTRITMILTTILSLAVLIDLFSSERKRKTLVNLFFFVAITVSLVIALILIYNLFFL